MNKKIIFILVAIVILIISAFFIKTYYKSSDYGNNISSKSEEEIEKYILNIESYEAIAEIKIDSNKNTNIYTVKQQYIKKDNLYKQEVVEPETIQGLSFTYDGKTLKIENKKLNTVKTYENYPYIADNNLGLNSFIQDYACSNESKYYEKENMVILETKIKNGNKYNFAKKLYIDKENNKIAKLEIQDITQKNLVYILYNEIKINSLQKEDILAFSLKSINSDI